MQNRSSIRMLIAAAALLVLTAGAHAQNTASPPVIRAGERTFTGIFINGEGHIAAPALVSEGAECVVEYDGERYPAKIVLSQPKYGLVILKIDRQQEFPSVTLSQKQATPTAKLRLRGRSKDGQIVERDATLRRIRRKIPELGMEGSHYEIGVVGEPPLEGAMLLSSDNDEVYGMLGSASAEAGERYALFSASISDRAATELIVLGPKETGKGRSLVFASGATSPASLRLLQFSAASDDRAKIRQIRAVQDWRRHTGFWINSLTSPHIDSDYAWFGSTNGMLYCVNMGSMQREWVFPNEYPVFFPPSVGANHICVASGDLALRAFQERDDSLVSALQLMAPKYAGVFGALSGLFTTRRTVRFMVDHGMINCVDRKSSEFKWSYPTRFVSQPHIVGDKVVFAGMGTLGVLNLADGKEVWVQDDGRKPNPVFYTVAGTDGERVWVLGMPARMEGDGTQVSPMRLEQDRREAKIECYRLDQKKPVWSEEVKITSGAPALSAAMTLSPDRKRLYGSTFKDLFAVDADTGKILWVKPTFTESFGGNIAFGDNMVFATSTDNKLYAVNAQDGSPLWTFGDANAPLCIPLAHEGVVYVGSLDTWIYALDSRTGKLVWKFETGGKVCGQPRILGNKLYCMSDDGHLTEVQLPQ